MAAKSGVKIGDKYSMLTVVAEGEPHVYPSGTRRSTFFAQCDCGSAVIKVMANNLKNGNTNSCGCWHKKMISTHGMSDTRQYQCWADMKTRCDNIDNEWYDSYGGRGITYCDKWKTFEGFWEDMQEGYSDDLTISRVDNDLGYYKDNCRWDKWSVQGHIRRKREGTYLGVIGGRWDKRNNKMYAAIRVEGKAIYLGEFEEESDLAEAYDYASEVYYEDRPNKTTSTKGWIKDKVDYFLANTDIKLTPKGSATKNAKLNEEQVKEILVFLNQKELKFKEIANLYKVSRSTIIDIKRGKSWNHVTNLPKLVCKKTKRKIVHKFSTPNNLLGVVDE